MGSRHIWLNFAQELQSNPVITRFEEPVEDYTAEELKEWVLRHHNAQKLLHTQGLDAQYEKRRMLRSGVGEVKLLPGGRWLLFIRGLSMFFVDCDTANLEPQELISTEAPTQNPLLRFTTWIDLDAPRLAFRVALIHWEKMRTDFCESFIAGSPSLIIHPDPTMLQPRANSGSCSTMSIWLVTVLLRNSFRLHEDKEGNIAEKSTAMLTTKA